MKKEENKKEKLLSDTVLEDAKKEYADDITSYAAGSAFLGGVSFLVGMVCQPADLFTGVILTILIGMFAGTLGYTLYLTYKCYTLPYKCTIAVDTLSDIVYRPSRYKPNNRFVFSEHGEYGIRYKDGFGYKEYYPWSKHHCMFADQLIMRSSKGDEFYLVLVGKKIVYVYNKKIFELIT